MGLFGEEEKEKEKTLAELQAEATGGPNSLALAFKGLAGLGDAVTGAYGTNKTNFADATQGVIDSSQKRKELAYALGEKKKTKDDALALQKRLDDPTSEESRVKQASAHEAGLFKGRDLSKLSASALDKLIPYGFKEDELALKDSINASNQSYKTSMINAMNKRSDAVVAAAGKKDTNTSFDHETKLRNEITALPEVKNYSVQESGFDKMQKSVDKNFNATPAGDMAMIYGFMKIQDPESSVREGEYATAEKARGVSGTVLNLYNKVLDGERLTPEQRKQFLAQAKAQLDGAHEKVQGIYSQYEPLIGQYGLKKENVIINRANRPTHLEETTPNGQSNGLMNSAVAGDKSAPNFDKMSIEELLALKKAKGVKK